MIRCDHDVLHHLSKLTAHTTHTLGSHLSHSVAEYRSGTRHSISKWMNKIKPIKQSNSINYSKQVVQYACAVHLRDQHKYFVWVKKFAFDADDWKYHGIVQLRIFSCSHSVPSAYKRKAKLEDHLTSIRGHIFTVHSHILMMSRNIDDSPNFVRILDVLADTIFQFDYSSPFLCWV